jgi:type III secretion protein C
MHEKNNINVILSPKILTEDNLTAELFVGVNTPFKTQSIANDQGSTITSNFEFKDVGITLLVTPYLGNSNMVTLEIEFEQSSIQPGTGQGSGLSNQSIGPTTNITRSKTRIHMPDGYFLVFSGLMQDTETRNRRQVPCLGGVPILGAAFIDKTYDDEKSNLMMFIRPQIIDTELQMDNLTEHQQNIFRVKGRSKRMWKLDYEETLDWLNAVQTDSNNDERECCQENTIWPDNHERHKRLCK